MQEMTRECDRPDREREVSETRRTGSRRMNRERVGETEIW